MSAQYEQSLSLGGGNSNVNQIAQDLISLNRSSNTQAGFSTNIASEFAAFGASSSSGGGATAAGGFTSLADEFASFGNSNNLAISNISSSGGAATSLGLSSGFGQSLGTATANQFGGASLSLGTSLGQQSSNIGTGQFMSEVEQLILRAQQPVQINETEEITVNGERGVWANRAEVTNWRGVIPIEQYVINQDANPEIITKRSGQAMEYIQELAIRYLRPPTPPMPGEIIIKQDVNTLTPPAPPLIIRQQPARPSTPEPLVIREAPPQPPVQVGRKVITISGRRIPPPPRKVVIERLPQIPSKPQSLIVERWLPYAQVKRRVIFQGAQQLDAVVVKPRNVIVQWEAPQVNVRREVKYLGVIRANPVEYVQRYGSTLKQSSELPQYVLDIKTPDGLTLAADFKYNNVHELEGDLQAFKFIDLHKEGLSEYSAYLQRMGISYQAAGGSSSLDFNSFGGNTSLGASSGLGGGLSLGGGAAGVSFGGATSAFGGATSAFGGSAFGAAAATSSQSSSGASAALIQQIFNSLNVDNDNRISRSEAEKALLFLNSKLGRSYGENEVNAFFARLDINHDGYISFEEFKRLFLQL